VLERRPAPVTLATMEQAPEVLDERSRAVLDFEREA
jgi:hypothetical protein